jgi:amino acid adenylation domain-containing protein
VQQIADATAEAMPIVDLSELGEEVREAEAVRLAAEEAQRPFDLGRGPLMRVGLVKLSENEHVALFTMHHIISDGWSMGVLVTEVASGYEGRVEGKEEEEKEELEVQYADYAVWQREWLQGEALERQLGYWRETLAGSPQVLELPTDRPRPLMKSVRGGRETRVLRTEVAEGLRQLSQERGATLFMSLLAAFKVMLMRYSGQKDIVVGTPIAGRTKRELEGLIGFFVNTLVLRTSLEGDPSFVELLESVREVAIGAYTHQDLPFEKLVEELQPQRDLGRDPLLQVLFVLQNIPAEGLKLPGLQLRGIPAESNTAKYDLTLMIQESNGGLTATINYSTDLYEARTMRRMLEQYETLLESIVGDPEQRISLLRVVTKEEQELMLGEWNETRREHDLSKCVHHLIARQAEATPGELAVVYEDREISYGELEERSNRLGRYLKKRGAGPEELIGICMERGIEMVVAVLGVLKSGAGYVPLDPSYPEERLEYMISDSGVKLVVTEKNVRRVVAGAGVEVVSIDDEKEEIAAERGEELEGGAEPENVAYVIYTSGSTGTPKGVTVTHRNLSNYAQTQIETFGVEAKMKVLQFMTLSFDVSMSEICLGLMTGSTLYVAPREATLGGTALIELLKEQAINIATMPPSVMTGLGEAELPELRTVITGGEVAPKETLRRWARGRRLFNAYGPTEGTICATVWEFDESRERVTIGRPIDNTEVYVLDGQMELAPIGVTGELYIGGEGVARGYHNRAELTAEKFVPNPYSKEGGRRLYRTGDLARRLANGEVEFVGRRDQQIKIRGHRVELGEIEKALNEHEGIEEAVVLMREDRAGDKRLVAYVVAAEGEEHGIGSELREYLMKRLPDYMVPSVFVPLEQMPLSPIGKLDRKALRRPEDFDSGLEPTHVAPRTDIEKAIAVIWREALQVQRVGIHDNFFDLGGHSLVLVQVHSKLQSAFGQELSVLQLFKYPTVASLASYMGETPAVVSSDPQPDDLGDKLKAGKSRLKQRTRLLNEGRGASNG